MLQSSGKGNALVKESFYARKAFFIDSGVGTSLVSEGEGEEGDSNPTPLMKQSNKLTIIKVSYMISSRIGKH